MATYQNGGVRTATPNSRKSAARSAASRQCPKCERKGALKRISEPDWYGSFCRWAGCGYVDRIDRT